MPRFLNSVRTTGIAVLLFTVLAPHATAQRGTAQHRATPGWIGIAFEVHGDRWGRAVEVIVTEISGGSPAEHAGLQPGDRLLAINDLNTVNELSELSERLRLEAGDPVELVVQREDRRFRLRIRAEERPPEYVVGENQEMSFQSDSMVETWVRAMDSLRIQLVEGSSQNIRITRAPGAGETRVRVVSTESGGNTRTVRAPFEFFIFRGEDHDSLRHEMVEINRVMEELEQRLSERELEVRRVTGTGDALPLAQDGEFRRLSLALDEVSLRSASLEAAMAAAARSTAGFEYERSAPRAPSRDVFGVARTDEFRPLTPYLLGRNIVAGAEVVDLRPELAEYFNVAGGVLVVDVAPGTPAAISGILPGDVITRVDQVGVRSVEDLRFGVSQAGETLPITLIRRETSIQVLLRR
jgi:membrane-associated protease RseP (regulator of RpoE activity)